jgi:hypothetical protein
MDWIKHNLLLVVSGLVALLAVGGSGYFFYLQVMADQDAEAKLTSVREELKKLQTTVPYPTQTNLLVFQDYRKQWQDFMTRAGRHFGEAQTNDFGRNLDFGAALAKTINDLQRGAKYASVTLPTNFSFGFSVQRERLQYDPTNLTTLSVQLEDIRNLCEILYQAKVYELVGVQRVAVSTNDTSASSGLSQSSYSSEYLSSSRTIVTNDLALIFPYQITFRCSSVELAAAMECIARSPYGITVKYLKVEGSETQAQDETGATAGAVFSPYTSRFGPGMSAAMAARYGLGPYGRRQTAPTPGAEATEPQKQKKGPGTILKERPIKVAMQVDVIKLRGPR